MKITLTAEIRQALRWAKDLLDHEVMAIQCGTDKNYTKAESARLKVLFNLLYEVNQNLESEEKFNAWDC